MWRLCFNYAPVILLRWLESPQIWVRIFSNSPLFRLAGHLTALERSSNTKDPAMFIDHFDQPQVFKYRCLLKLHTIIQSGRRGVCWATHFRSQVSVPQGSGTSDQCTNCPRNGWRSSSTSASSNPKRCSQEPRVDTHLLVLIPPKSIFSRSYF